MRKLFALVFAAAMAATVACGGGSDNPSSPMAPSAVTNPTSPAGPTTGALVTGTVTVASSSRTVTVRDTSGLTVSVAGTSLNAPVDGNGNFSLDGVPSGDVQIRITGSNVDVTLWVNGVQAGQTVRLKITVSGSSGSIDSDSRDGASSDDASKKELEGRIESVFPATSSLIVAGQTVMVTPSTVIRKVDNSGVFDDLKVGLRVHVKGTMDATTTPPSLVASEVKIQNENVNVPMKVEGVVAATPAPAGSCPGLTFYIEGKNIKVMTDSSTNFKPGCSALVAGAEVEVMGRLVVTSSASDEMEAPNGSTLLASKIEVEDSNGRQASLKGEVSGLSGSCPSISFTVGGTSVQTGPSTKFKPSCSAVQNGVEAEVEVVMSSTGPSMAKEVEVEDDGGNVGDDDSSKGEETEFKATISGLAGSCPAITFTAGGKSVVANGATSFKPSCNALKSGDTVEVKGKTQSDGTVLATKISKE